MELNGDDLYENYEVLKKVIGYVPQSDIVYDNLTVKQMLHYAAKLRMPDDTSKQERISKVQEVIETVELKGHESKLIKKLSGGQKKRVSIAIELLSSPKLFFLDEPSFRSGSRNRRKVDGNPEKNVPYGNYDYSDYTQYNEYSSV